MLSICLCVLALLVLLSIANAQGAVQLFDSTSCTSANGSSIEMVANLCLETYQVAAISILSLPSCSTGGPVLVMSDQDTCPQPSASAASSSETGVCLYLSSGKAIGAAIFFCQESETNTASWIPHVASQTTSSSARTTLITTSSQTSLTTTTAPINQASSNASNQNNSSSSGLSTSNKIALGIGISFGVPSLVLAFFSWRNGWMSLVLAKMNMRYGERRSIRDDEAYLFRKL
jgi:hypothetical protein